MYRGLGQTGGIAIPWGSPAGATATAPSWMVQYAPWLLLGALAVLAVMTAPKTGAKH
jgi:hypothetical protein